MSASAKILLFITIASLLLIKPTSSVSGNYANQGQDWTGTCQINGATQSPLSVSAGTNDPNLQQIYLEFDEWVGSLSFTPNNYILKFDRPQNNNGRAVLTYNGNKCSYTALRLQFHAPAEHSVNYRDRDLEAAFILQRDLGSCTGPEYIGLSFLFDSDIPSQNQFLNSLGITDSAAATGNAIVSGTAKIPTLITDIKASGFWTYTGSLTSGNCEQVCLWLIGQTQYKITANQQAFFDNLWKNNAGFQKTAGQGNNRVLMNKLNSPQLLQGHNQGRRSYSIPESRLQIQTRTIQTSLVPDKLDSASKLTAFNFIILALVAVVLNA